ncbi:hypothetical protein GCM10009802_31470 [Streptomyces synnematoformans]|uniref:Uncharacterized protein n=1 Tax=Streptomyces synnematoformans TaxID=415721 RepID=A0ABP5K6F0_9ACTN
MTEGPRTRRGGPVPRSGGGGSGSRRTARRTAGSDGDRPGAGAVTPIDSVSRGPAGVDDVTDPAGTRPAPGPR